MTELSRTAAATRQHIADTFFSMYQEMPIEKITISALSQSAHVHRSTIYAYFADVYAILDFIEEDTVNRIATEFKDIDLSFSKKIPAETFAHVILTFSKYIDKVYLLVNHSSSFRKRLYQTMQPIFQFNSAIDNTLPHYDFLANYVFNNLIIALNFWHENQDRYTLEEVVYMTRTLMTSSILSFKESLISASSLPASQL